jgi:hypothetical protein
MGRQSRNRGADGDGKGSQQVQSQGLTTPSSGAVVGDNGDVSGGQEHQNASYDIESVTNAPAGEPPIDNEGPAAEEISLDAYVVEPKTKKKKKPKEVLKGQVVDPTTTSTANAPMSTCTMLLLTFFGGVLLFAVVAVSVFFALKEEAPTPTPLVIIEVEPTPTSSPTTGAPSIHPTASLEPSLPPTGVPTTEAFSAFKTLLDAIYFNFYEGIELGISDSGSSVARVAAWMADDNLWLRGFLGPDAAEIDLNFLFAFMERFSLVVFYFATNGE